MAERERDTPEDRDNLVAYLDGELTESEARAVEAKLGQDGDVRREAEALQHTWDLLDYLPRPQATQEFTNRTLDRLDTLQLRQATRARRLRWLANAGWAAAVTAAGVLGFLGFHHWFAAPESGPKVVKEQPAPEVRGEKRHGAPTPPPELTPEELRVLEHYRDYEKIPDVQFLTELEQIFGEDS